jgi:hypothetical protein
VAFVIETSVLMIDRGRREVAWGVSAANRLALRDVGGILPERLSHGEMTIATDFRRHDASHGVNMDAFGVRTLARPISRRENLISRDGPGEGGRLRSIPLN